MARGSSQRLQLQDKIDALKEELESRNKALQTLEEENRQAMLEQHRLRETFSHYTSKEARLGEELKEVMAQQNDIRKKVRAAILHACAVSCRERCCQPTRWGKFADQRGRGGESETEAAAADIQLEKHLWRQRLRIRHARDS